MKNKPRLNNEDQEEMIRIGLALLSMQREQQCNTETYRVLLTMYNEISGEDWADETNQVDQVYSL